MAKIRTYKPSVCKFAMRNPASCHFFATHFPIVTFFSSFFALCRFCTAKRLIRFYIFL